MTRPLCWSGVFGSFLHQGGASQGAFIYYLSRPLSSTSWAAQQADIQRAVEICLFGGIGLPMFS
jgi:hypothetical protein